MIEPTDTAEDYVGLRDGAPCGRGRQRHWQLVGR